MYFKINTSLFYNVVECIYIIIILVKSDIGKYCRKGREDLKKYSVCDIVVAIVLRRIHSCMGGNDYKKGIMYILSAYVLWGFLPIYWKSLSAVDSYEILCWRVCLSLLFMLIIIGFTGVGKFVEETKNIIRNTNKLMAVSAAGVLVTLNWLIFIVAVNHGNIVQTSLGYYINPLLSIVLGVYYFKEHLSVWLKISFALAMVGVVIMSLRVGEVPWVSLGLALTFGLYGLIKKGLSVSLVTGLTLETLIVTPICALYIYYRHTQGVSALEMPGGLQFFLSLSGMITAIPLMFFSAGAKLLPLNITGFVQYVSPTISLLLGVFVYGELFTGNHLLAFSFIWVALSIFTLSQTKFFNNFLQRVFLK